MGIKLRHRKLKDGSKSYYLDYYFNGERWKENLDLRAGRGRSQSVKDQAEEILATRQLEFSANNNGVVSVTAKNKSFSEYFRDYAATYTKGDKGAVKGCYTKFMEFLGNKCERRIVDGRWRMFHEEKYNLPFGSLTERKCEEFRDFILAYRDSSGEPLKGETPVNYWAKFKKIVKQARKDKLIRNLPTEFITLYASDCPPTEPKDVLTKAEVSVLKANPCSNVEVYKAFLYCCATGLRTSEVRAHSPADLKILGNRLYVEVAQKKGINPKPKLIPLNSMAVDLLGQYTPGSKEPFFKLPTQNGVNKIIKTWLKDCGIDKHITFYCARHTFGTRLIANGVDPISAAGMLGHSSLKHLRRYAHEVNENKEAAVDKLDF